MSTSFSQAMNLSQAMFGAGCFWGVEAAFRDNAQLEACAVGYAGGTVTDPTYKQVCSGATGHAEVIHVRFNPEHTPYDTLLQIFWNCHNPTHVNRQGVDVGSQYRSVLFYYDEDQRSAALTSLRSLEQSGKYDAPIATAIEPAPTFWMAEEYHQQYLARNR